MWVTSDGGIWRHLAGGQHGNVPQRLVERIPSFANSPYTKTTTLSPVFYQSNASSKKRWTGILFSAASQVVLAVSSNLGSTVITFLKGMLCKQKYKSEYAISIDNCFAVNTMAFITFDVHFGFDRIVFIVIPNFKGVCTVVPFLELHGRWWLIDGTGVCLHYTWQDTCGTC